MANKIPGNDATAARKLARSEPMSGRNSCSDETVRRGHSVRDLYSLGRTYPNRQPQRERVQRQPDTSDYAGHLESEKPQSIEDSRDIAYYNDHDVNDWVRGGNEDATRRPNFDHSKPRDKMRR